MRKKLAFGIDARVLMRPSIVDCCPPVTRLRMLAIELGPRKVALPPVGHVEQTEAVEKVVPSDCPRVDAVGIAEAAHHGSQCSVSA